MTNPPMRRVFVIEALAAAQLPMRLLNYFARQHLVPETIDLRRSHVGFMMRITGNVLDPHRTAVILAKMQTMPEAVLAVLTPC